MEMDGSFMSGVMDLSKAYLNSKNKGSAESSAPAGGSFANSKAGTDSWLDVSGWTVTTGQGEAGGATQTQSGGAEFLNNPLLLVGVFLLVGLALWRRKK